MREEVHKVFSDTLAFQAKQFKFKKDKYNDKFLKLLNKIYQNYQLIINDKIKIPINENKIRDILVDDYLSRNIKDYQFKKEKDNNLGRVDIFIQETLTEEKPEFIIECKVLDNKTRNGTTGKNAEYIKNGIQRFLTEYYFSFNNLYVNAMIGFIVEKIDIKENIKSINILSQKLLNNLVNIAEPIKVVDENIYQSKYLTMNDKEFILYHQMMDFSDNV